MGAMRPFAWHVTERRELALVGRPLGAGRECGGLPEWRRGVGNAGPGKVCITLALCKSGREGSPSGAALAE